MIALPFALGLLIAAATAIFLAILQWRVRAAELRTPSVEARDLLFAQLEAMVGATAEALVAVDSLGLVVAANPAAENLFRLTPYQMRTKKLIELLPDSSIERLQSAMENGQSSNDGAVRRARLHGVAMRRGARVPVELNLGVVAAKSDMMVCLIRDVSEHQRVEEEMRLYKRAIASSSNAIVISDVTMADHPILYRLQAHEPRTMLHGDTRRTRFHDERRDLLAALAVHDLVRRPRHDHQQLGARSVGAPELLTIQRPVCAILARRRAGAHVRRVRPRVRLSQGERRNCALGQAREEALFLLVGAEQLQWLRQSNRLVC